MPSVTAYLNKYYKQENGECAIYLRVFINATDRYALIPLEVAIPEKNWNETKQQVEKLAKAKEINHLINEAKGRASDIILRYKVNRIPLSKNLFIKEYSNPVSEMEFLTWFDKEIEERLVRDEINKSSFDTQKVHWRKLKLFRDKIAFAELTPAFLNEFELWMAKGGSSINTRGSNLKTLKTYVSIAFRRGLLSKNPFADKKIKVEDTYPKFLELPEMRALYAAYLDNKFDKEYHYRTVRYFLFCANTGIRISDLLSATVGEVIERNGVKYFNTIQEKTKKPIHIPLNANALRLIDDEYEIRKGKQLFMCYTEQKLNMYIKQACKLVIDKQKASEITFHWARHTFASLLISNGYDVVTVSKLLGHASPTTTLNFYAHLIPGNTEKAVKFFE